ncbi:hypothetical protein BOX15_Mlig003751g2, partial [Macrostomum lignano]
PDFDLFRICEFELHSTTRKPVLAVPWQGCTLGPLIGRTAMRYEYLLKSLLALICLAIHNCRIRASSSSPSGEMFRPAATLSVLFCTAFLLTCVTCRLVSFSYLGCYKDNPSTRDLNGLSGVSKIGGFSVHHPSGSVYLSMMSHKLCSSICSIGSFSYFGVQYGMSATAATPSDPMAWRAKPTAAWIAQETRCRNAAGPTETPCSH